VSLSLRPHGRAAAGMGGTGVLWADRRASEAAHALVHTPSGEA